MKKVSYSVTSARAPDGEGIEITSSLLDFLLDIPYLFPSECIPPLSVLNSILIEGFSIASMGEVLAWKPFNIKQDEYEEVVEILILDSQSNYFIDEELADIEEHQAWTIAVFSKYFDGAREVIDRLQSQE